MNDDVPRFDVSYGKDDARLDYHFCREWDDDGGCYGSNPSHGLAFDDAKEIVAQYYEARARAWRELTLAEFKRHGGV
jgi:hypothetical protein